MFVSQWGTVSTGEGQFNWPLGVAVTSDGSVYIADSWNEHIQKFSSTGVLVSKWDTVGTGEGYDMYHAVVLIE